MINNAKENNRKGLFFITTGLLLIAAAIFLTAYNLYDNRRAAASAKEVLCQLEEEIQISIQETSQNMIKRTDVYETDVTDTNERKTNVVTETGERSAEHTAETIIPDYILNPLMDMPEKTVDGSNYIGILTIPSLALELPVISDWNYNSLKTAPCRYSGSVYQKNLVICGHDYSSHFGNLKLLGIGDTAIFTDMDGNTFSYTLAEMEILQPSDIEEMENSGWSMTLFTCTIGGQNRLTLRFELME